MPVRPAAASATEALRVGEHALDPEVTAVLDTYHAMKSGNLWYYEHAAKMARHTGEDLVPTYEYLFRHMRSLLWVSRFANFLHLPMTRLGRYVLDERVMHELMHRVTARLGREASGAPARESAAKAGPMRR